MVSIKRENEYKQSVEWHLLNDALCYLTGVSHMDAVGKALVLGLISLPLCELCLAS
jgi:hypothetical protein